MAVLVYAENWDGRFKKLVFELVSYASKVAEMLNTSASVVSIGNVEESELKKLGSYGARKVLKVEGDPFRNLDNQVYTNIISRAAEKEGADVILLPHSNTGKALAPRLSVTLKAALGTSLIALPVSLEPFTVYKKVFSGKAYATIVLKSEKKVLTLAQNSFELIETDNQAVIESFAPGIDEADIKTKVIDRQKQSGKILLTDAEIVVSGGRGMRSGDNWGPLEELAAELGAATACSRPVSDEGWRPHEEHAGQTGKIIAPNLYFAIGISGAIQHLAGVSSSKCIVAINTDPDAPIFEAADYGILGDALKVLPALVDAVKEMKAQQ